MSNVLRQAETITLFNESGFTGIKEVPFSIVTGSRMLVTLLVTSIDSGASIAAEIQNNFNVSDPYETLDTINVTASGRYKRIFSDFHNQFNIAVTVSGGNASFKIAVSLFDNALSTKIENAEISVDLRAADDSVKSWILDENGNPFTDSNPFPVTFVSNPGIRRDLFNQVSAVVNGAETQVITYTVPVGKTAELYRCQVSGEQIALYQLYKDNQLIGVKRTHFATDLNETFNFNSNTGGLKLQAGEIIKITVTHFRPDAASFEADLQLLESL